jgi:hypothetical protein
MMVKQIFKFPKTGNGMQISALIFFTISFENMEHIFLVFNWAAEIVQNDFLSSA